jgi:hypothetical protein
MVSMRVYSLLPSPLLDSQSLLFSPLLSLALLA